MKAINKKPVLKTFALSKELLQLCMTAASKDKRTFSAWARIQLEKAVKIK